MQALITIVLNGLGISNMPSRNHEHSERERSDQRKAGRRNVIGSNQTFRLDIFATGASQLRPLFQAPL